MAQPFMGEIRIFSFNYPPKGWALCSGQLMPINQMQPLFSLLGTTYGGDGRTTFGLPNLMGRAPVHMGNGFSQGVSGGAESVALNQQQLPAHNHQVMATTAAGDQQTCANNGLAAAPRPIYGPFDSAVQPMNSNVVSMAGGNQPHENMQPYLALNFCIALQGIFPSPN
jgi:microcystin-dependent protein